MGQYIHAQKAAVLTIFHCFICCTAVQAQLPDPVSMWRFEEGSGNTAVDTGAGGYHGRLVGDVFFVQDDERGSVLEFGSSESYVDTNAWVAEFGNADFSMAAWINTYREGTPIVGKSNGDRDWSFHEKQFYLSAGTEQGTPVAGGAHFYGNQAGEIWGATPVNTGRWHHVCVTWNSETDEQHVYVDGELDDLSPIWVYYGGRGDNVDDVVRIGFDCSGNTTSDFIGRMDDVAIFDVPLTPAQVTALMNLPLPANASNPQPYDRSTDLLPQEILLRWRPGPSAKTHNVYFGKAFADVNDASVDNPLGVLASEAQSENTYDPGLLDYEQTYFWRVDEVSGAPDFTVIKGNVWNFSTEPIALPLENIKATASSSDLGSDPNKTVDGSGLNEMNQHSTLAEDSWLSATETPAWIQYEFERVYKLREMWVWNANQSLELLFGLGAKDVVIETSVNGVDWVVLEGDTQFNQGPGAEGYEYNTTIDLGELVAKYVKINIHSGWGPLGKYSLSEVRFFSIPVHARKHEPTDGAVDVGTAALLTWRAGREAGSHDVYLDTDEQAVRDGTAPVVTVTETSTMMDLDLGHTYFWKVNEVNTVEDPAIWEGDTLRFSTRAYLVVDDFEMYADMESKEIWAFWTDGYDDPGNGSLVGYGDIGERTIVHGGNQSMPLAYSNAGGATYSKTIRYFDDPQDWTMGGAQTLVLYFYGAPDNTGQLSVKVNNRTEITYGGSADAIATAEWTQWTIDLDSLGTDLKRVTEMSIGVQTGSGLVLIDDIRLYRIAPGLGTE
jgi:hypothetical protein